MLDEHSVEGSVPLGIAVLTISDTRTRENDTSGQYLADQVAAAGHRLIARAAVPDDVYMIRARLSTWLVHLKVQVVITTGGTGLTPRDHTPEAVRVLLEREVDGFGELFRMVSHGEIGTSTLQSRAFAGLANNRLIICLPGSTSACRTAWDRILRPQLDSRHRPCNFVQLLCPPGRRLRTATVVTLPHQ